MGRRGYPPEFRRKVLDLIQAGRPVADMAKALSISDQSIYTWRRQDRIDHGQGKPGELTTSEPPGAVAAAAAGGRTGEGRGDPSKAAADFAAEMTR